jgi:hypothetical protein
MNVAKWRFCLVRPAFNPAASLAVRSKLIASGRLGLVGFVVGRGGSSGPGNSSQNDRRPPHIVLGRKSLKLYKEMKVLSFIFSGAPLPNLASDAGNGASRHFLTFDTVHDRKGIIVRIVSRFASKAGATR